MEVCRQEESKLLKLLNVAVHPLEAKAIEEKSQKMGGALKSGICSTRTGSESGARF